MDILALFRTVAPEFSNKTDNEVNIMLELAKPHVSKERFGKFYNEAVAYYTAHRLSLLKIVSESGNSDGSIIGGSVVMEKEGDLQRQYSFNSNESNSLLDKTYYGKEFKRLAKQCIVPVMTRMG